MPRKGSIRNFYGHQGAAIPDGLVLPDPYATRSSSQTPEGLSATVQFAALSVPSTCNC